MERPEKALDEATLAQLARPFSLEQVRYKVLTRAGDDGKAGAIFYMDARLVAERLNYVVGPECWTDEYRPLLSTGPEMAGHYFPVECALTVLGVKKVDCGSYQRDKADENAWKAAYSDAFKRVAVKFRVGAYLYAIPRLRVPVRVGQDNKVLGFTRDGEKELKQAYLRWIANENLNVFGEPLEHISVLPAGDGAAADEEADLFEFPQPQVQR